MLVGLFLMHKDSVEGDNTELVAYAKSLEELIAWYQFNIQDPVGILSNYIPLEKSMFMLRKSVNTFTGFVEVISVEELIKQLDTQVEAAHQSARDLLDDYRTNVEPKAVSFNVHTSVKNTIQ